MAGDIGTQLNKNENNTSVVHMDYDNYDGHRHRIRVLENTPLHEWFRDCLEEGEDGNMEMDVNSYHHQGVKKLAERFVAMAYSPDGLIEGFYDPNFYNPEEGEFIMGLQFHPERMRRQGSYEFDYPGCPLVYKEFCKAVISYERKINNSTSVSKSLKLATEEMEKKTIRATNFYLQNVFRGLNSSELEFFELNRALSVQQETRLKQMGATVRNASSYLKRLELNEEREKLAKNLIAKVSMENLTDLMSFYHMMANICSQLIHKRLNGHCE